MRLRRVKVEGDDYAYHGFLVALFHKAGGAHRVVVEDDSGRLFIHRPEQVTEVEHAVQVESAEQVDACGGQ